MRQILDILNDAYQRCARNGIDIWQYAVEVDQVYRLGASVNQIREAVQLGFCSLRSETTDARYHQRTFRKVHSLLIPSNACLIITTKGREQLDRIRESGESIDHISKSSMRPADFIPEWNSELRQLKLEGIIVKQFHRKARNQTIVLAVFQEDEWPRRISDPLPPNGTDPKRRLNDTIRGLNTNHLTPKPTIRFRGDGSGTGVIWEFIEEAR